MLALLHERRSSVERAERRVKAMQVKDGAMAPSDGRELEYVATGFLPRERELLEYVTTVLGGR